MIAQLSFIDHWLGFISTTAKHSLGYPQPALLHVGQQVKLMAAISNGISSASASPKLNLLTPEPAELWEAALTPEGAAFPIWYNAQVCPVHVHRAHLAPCSFLSLRAQQQQNSNLHLSYTTQKAQTDKA